VTFILVREIAKQEPPLLNLKDALPATGLYVTAKIDFYGHERGQQGRHGDGLPAHHLRQLRQLRRTGAMKARTIGLTVLLAAGWRSGPACKRDALSEPGPVGPSTIFQTFTLSVSTDVIMAGTTRTSGPGESCRQQGTCRS